MTRLQKLAAWLREAAPGDTYIYHVGYSLAAEREQDKELDRIARALTIAVSKTPAKVMVFAKSSGKQVIYSVKRLNDPPVPLPTFVQTADPRVPAYGCRNRGSAGAPGKTGMVRSFS